MRQGKVFYQDDFAGFITETDEGTYQFQYDTSYLQKRPTDCITFTMPVREEVFESNRLFPFFEGLIPEGWLLNIAISSWKVNPNDRMGLLLATCSNCIGAVSVIPVNQADE